MRIELGAADLEEGELRGYDLGKRAVCVARVNGRYKVGFDLDTGANATSPGVCDDQPTARVNVEAGRLMLEVEEGS